MLRILIADDEEIERKYLAALFVKHSDTYKVVGEACNGREVLELTAKNSPDIIIMDINMPGLDGLTSAQRIKQRFPDTIILLNTASLQLIPTTAAMLRLQAGSGSPMEILPAVWLSSVLSVLTGIAAAKGIASLCVLPQRQKRRKTT